MHSACGRYVIAFNGEIYNYRELFRRYLTSDAGANGSSDTSVLLHLYMRFGRRCLQLLDGMFAFALCDLHAQRLFLARDRFGEKPLYWMRRGHTVSFASELRGLRALDPAHTPSLDEEACAIYHMMGSIPAPKTIYQGVHALLPGHWLEYANGEIRQCRYWSLPAPVEEPPQQDVEDAVEATSERLLDAVRSRMVSDVPVGLFLSGGFDSGSILGLLAASRFASITSLCLDFPDADYSEYALAKRTSEHFGGHLRRHVIDADQFVRSLPAFFEAMDQPTNDGFNTFFVCQAAKESGIKVWLSGVGGDELFGGYPSFARLRRVSLLSRFLSAAPAEFIDIGAAAARRHPKLSRVVHLGDAGCAHIRAYQTLRNTFPWRLARDVLAPIWDADWRFPDLLDTAYPDPNPRSDPFQLATLFESHVYMRSQLLRDMDNFSMAHSLELRAPFLSHRLFESVYLLPQSAKARKGELKPLLAQSLPTPLPTEVRTQSKRGFTFPLAVWLRSFMRTSFEEVVFDGSMIRLWDRNSISTLWNAYLDGRVHWGMMWQLYAFGRWYQQRCVR
jgi:asparagine synthase (glutamine-hydrolysing)